MKVVRQPWVESERGWGVRPDGDSLHLSMQDLWSFVADYWRTMPDQAPDEYSRPQGDPDMIEVEADLHREVAATRNGLRRL